MTSSKAETHGRLTMRGAREWFLKDSFSARGGRFVALAEARGGEYGTGSGRHCNKFGVGASAHSAETRPARSPGIWGEPDEAEF